MSATQDAAPDLTAAADTLNRAADKIERLRERLLPLADWFTTDDLVEAGFHCRQAKFIAAFSPQAMAELVPALRMAARGTVGLTGLTLTVNERRLIEPLLSFARRVLKEETGG